MAKSLLASLTAEAGPGDDFRIAAGPFGEAVPGWLGFATFVQQTGRIAELTEAAGVGPGEPPNAGDAPGAAVIGEHREGLVELASLTPHAALPASLEAIRTPAKLGDVDRRGGVLVAAHDAAQVADLRLHRVGIGDIGVQSHPIKEALYVARTVDAVEEVARGDIGGNLQWPTEKAAEDHLGAMIGAVDGTTRDA